MRIPSPMTEKLNVRFFIVLLGSVGVLAGGWSAVHALQVRRNAGALLAYASRAEDNGEDDRAVKLLGLFLDREPERVDVRAHYALLRARLARSPAERRDVIGIFEQVLEQEPGRDDIRRKLVTVAIQTGELDVASRHLAALRQAFPDDSDLALQRGQCEEA